MAEIKSLVPAMTSVNTPEGECILYATGGSPAGDAPFYRVFDGNPSTIGGWANNDVNGTGTKDAYIGYHFTKPIKCAYAEFRWGGENDSRYIFGVKLQGSNDGTNWIDLSESINIQKKTTPTVIESTKPDKYFTYLCIRYVSYSAPTNTGYPQAHEIQFYGTDDPPHIKSSGSTEAIRDWLNASLYNKEEIDDLFIQNNQSGLIPYDLMIVGDQPEQMIKLVGQTSGKTYNICLAAILGEMAMDRFNINEYETQGKFLDGSDICGWAVPFFKNGAVESHWSNSGNTWTNSEINSDTIDDLLYAFVINQNQQGVYSFGTGTIQWNKASGNFTLNFGTSYNTWIMLIYTKP